MRVEEKKIRFALRRGTEALWKKKTTPTPMPTKPLDRRPGGPFAIVGGGTLRPPPPPPLPPPAATPAAAMITSSSSSTATSAAAAAAAAAATAADYHHDDGRGGKAAQRGGGQRYRDAELALVLHRAGAFLNPFAKEASALGLESTVKRGKKPESRPWRVRYGEDGRPRWMKRIVPDV
ncbi:unnamed protein product, partial [Ectocarpus sp. 4 AP-2014]